VDKLFCVEYVGPTTNKIYAGKHWRYRQKEKEKCAWLMKKVLPVVPEFKGPVKLVFQGRIGKRNGYYDTDNYGYTCKMILDCLVTAGKLVSDKPDIIKEFTILAPTKITKNQVFGLKGKNYMMVLIEEVDNG